MRGKPATAAAEIAARQHGVVARRQLREAGVGDDRIDRLAKAGHLIRLHRGVFAVGHRAIGHMGRAMAAVLACGPGAVLAGMWAAALWGLCRWPRGDVEVIARSGRARKGIKVRRTALARGDVTHQFGIPVTTPARTLKDLGEPQRLVAAAQVKRLIPSPPEGITRSELERRFLRVVEEAGLPAPLMNQRIEGFEVDAVWPEQRLVVELDGWEFHRTREAFERDRERDAVLTAAGWRPMRLTARGLHAERIRRALARGPA
jgi:hypothetical protein